MQTEGGLSWTEDPRLAWSAYDPASDGPWNLPRAAHLHRRAGFGTTKARLARDVDQGHESAIRHILEDDAHCPDGRTRTEYDDIRGAMADSALRDPSMSRVRLAWLFRLVNSPHPLKERMTLTWHGHYATGARKVADPLAMLAQHDAMARLWDAPISQLHRAMLESSAMQIWLDGRDSVKGKPNENLGREFLELFAIGEAAYAEADVKAAAQALTGYRRGVSDDPRLHPLEFDQRRHDDREKTILGETGHWGLADLVRIASKHPCAAIHVARRLFVTFIDDIEPPPPPLIEALADLIRTDGDVDLHRGVEVVLRSRLFHSATVRGRKVKSPVDFAVGLVRCSGWYRPTPDLALIDLHLTRMGQTLFDPPSVAGWPAGFASLGAPFLIARANFVAEITSAAGIEGQLHTIAQGQGMGTARAWSSAIAEAFLAGGPRDGAFRIETTYAQALRTVTSLPEAHLS